MGTLSHSLISRLIPLSGGGEQLVEAAHSGFQDMYRVGRSAVV